MKKVTWPIALALLGLTAGTLFGNPLETTIIKDKDKSGLEADITGNIDNKSFSLDASLPMGNTWEWEFSSDMQYGGGVPRINTVNTAVGNKNFFASFSYGDLSSESSLMDTSILKAQTGVKPFDWLDVTFTGAKISSPKNSVDLTSVVSGPSDPLVFDIPLTLYATGWNINAGKEFALTPSLSLFPWLSIKESTYWAVPEINDDFKAADSISPGEGVDSMDYPFQHLNVQGGLDFDINQHFRVSYKGTFDGQPYFHLSPLVTPLDFQFNFTNMLGLRMYDKDKFNLDYDVSIITKPPYAFDNMINPLRNELQIDLTGFNLFKNGLYLKGGVSALIDFLSPNQFSGTAAVGWKFKQGGNLELYFNSRFNPADGSQNNVLGVQYSTNLDTSIKRESQARYDFNGTTRSNPTLDTYNVASDLTALHNAWGNTLEEALTKMHSENDISQLLSLIQYKVHPDGYFTAKQEYEQTDWGDCEDTNGNLGVVLEKALNKYKNVYSPGLRGAFNSHAAIILETQEGKYNIRSFEKYWELNAPTAQAALSQVFPGAYIYDDATRSTAVTVINNAVESMEWDFTKSR